MDKQEQDNKHTTSSGPTYLQNIYRTIRKEAKEKFGFSNIHMVPELEKIVLNMSSKRVLQDNRALREMNEALALIAAQKPRETRARKSIAQFKIREGVALGAAVTLRGKRMYQFLERLTYGAMPKIKDFWGLPKKSFNRNTYSFGVKEHYIFPEIDYDKITNIFGINITFVFKKHPAKVSEQDMYLAQQYVLEQLGVPFIS